MKIAIIGPTYPYRGGISHYNTLLCRSLSKKHDVLSISFKRLYLDFLIKLFYKQKIDFKDKTSKKVIDFKANEIIDSVNPLTWIKAFFEVKKHKADLVIIPWWTPFFAPCFYFISLLIKMFTKTKILFLCHNVVPHEGRIIDRIITRFVFKNANYFITHSKEDARELKYLIKDAKVKVAFHPSYDVFKFGDISKEKAKKLLNIKGNVILFFGFVRKYKGLIYLIKAMPLVLKKLKLKLLVVGEFWKDVSKDEIEKEINKLGIKENVKIIDEYVPNEDVAKYYRASDVVVLPYLSATNSGIVQTAFGLERPVIVTRVGGLPEVVTDNKTGFVVRSKNYKEIANAIIKFYKEKKENEFIKNIKHEKEKFSWNRMVETIESFS